MAIAEVLNVECRLPIRLPNEELVAE